MDLNKNGGQKEENWINNKFEKNNKAKLSELIRKE